MSAKEARLSIVDLMNVPEADHDIAWLRLALQWAVELELATLPPYLCARWSIHGDVQGPESATSRLKTIARDEMDHMGVAANLLAAIGGTPNMRITPTYPSPVPGGVHPGLVVTLGALTETQLRLFMTIEEPEVALPKRAGEGETFATIGLFYEAILRAFLRINPELSAEGQVSAAAPVMRTLADVEREIKKIMEVGEGTSGSPYFGDKLAHHYQFGEILHRKKFVKTPTGGWDYIGADVPFPEGIYTLTSVASDEESKPFNEKFTEVLSKLQEAWTTRPDAFWESVGMMHQLAGPAQQLMASGKWPSFKFLGDASSATMVQRAASTAPSVKARALSSAERTTTAPTRLASFYELTLPSGHRIHLPEGFDEHELRRLLSVLAP